MGRTFIILAAVILLMIAVTGTGVFYLSQASIKNAENAAIQELAKGAAQSISTRTSVLRKTLQNIAQSTDIIEAVYNNKISHARAMIKQRMYLPGTMTFRLLLATDTEPDLSTTPELGYADLDLVKNTFQKEQAPLIQGSGKNRHLAISQGIVHDKKVIAVLLASVSFKELQSSLRTIFNEDVYLELKQADFVLLAHGDNSLKESANYASFNIVKTSWTLSYWNDDELDMGLTYELIAIMLITSILSLFACFILFRQLEKLFIEDQRSALKATKDILTGKAHGHHYPAKLKEMETFIATILQFKRALEGKSIETAEANAKNDQELDSFFETSEASEFLGSEFSKYAEHVSTTQVGSAISLPGDSDEVKPKRKSKSSKKRKPKKSASKPASVDSIFRAYDIRGIVETALTDRVVYDLARTLGSEAIDKGVSTMVIAQDGRISSPILSKSLIDGLLSTGINILDIGAVPTPVLYFVAHHHDDHSGIMLTGSHNPPEYNGLKMVIAGETLAGERIQALKKRMESKSFHADKAGTLSENSMFANEYIGVIADDIRIARPMKVVLDAGNGVAGELGVLLLKSLGCEVIELFCDIDGTFPNHHPDPSKPENLSSLITAVAQHQADVGIAFDGDGDRLGVVDSNGKIIWPDRLLMFFAKHVLARKPGAEIIYDVKCSRNVETQIKKSSGRPTMWKTGHSFMKTKVQQSAAAFGGEMSGHFFFNDRWFGFDDGLYSAARLVEILSEDARHSAEVFADFPDSPNTPELAIELEEGESKGIMEQVLAKANFPDGVIIDIDGLRVDFDDGFGLVRASNTTPSLTLRFEGDNDEALSKIQEQFRTLLLNVKSDISLPF
ncbi:MAG: phosphomannomutase/phosphoglucomutase [Methyloprofundus sp.]|nr:phosphomannomutase/phosphoglucomutase [Methyloprofundus sp.]